MERDMKPRLKAKGNIFNKIIEEDYSNIRKEMSVKNKKLMGR